MKENYYDPTTTMRRPSAFETQAPLTTKPEGPLRASNLRFITLGLISIISFGASFSTSSTLAVEYQYQIMSYVPYVFFPLFGGAIVDKWGLRAPLVVFGALVALGNIFLSAGYQGGVGAFEIGAILLAIGPGCLLVAQATIASKWFRNKELALAIGSYLGMSKIASLLGNAILFNNYTGHRLYDSDDNYNYNYDDNDKDSDLSDYVNTFSTQQTIFDVGVGLSIFSLVGIIALVILDKKADDQESALCQNQGIQQSVSTGPIGLKNYPLVFYLLASCFLIQGVFLGFDRIFFDELVTSQEYVSDQISGIEFYTWVGIIFALLFPVFGFVVDRFGKKTAYLMVSSIAFTITCIIAIIIMANNYEIEEITIEILYIFVDAIFQPIFLCVFWFCIPLVFEQKIMGIGVGIAVSITNLIALTCSGAYYFALGDPDEGGLAEYFQDLYDFKDSLIFMAILAFFGTIFSIWLYREDARNGGKLSNPSVMKVATNSSSFASNSAFL